MSFIDLFANSLIKYTISDAYIFIVPLSPMEKEIVFISLHWMCYPSYITVGVEMKTLVGNCQFRLLRHPSSSHTCTQSRVIVRC